MLRAFTALEGVNAAGKMELKQIKACSPALSLKGHVRGTPKLDDALLARWGVVCLCT